MISLSIFVLLASFISSSFVACQDGPIAKQPEQPLDPSPWVKASNQFGLNLINQINPSPSEEGQQVPEPGNVLISPLGLAASLTMLQQGADGKTAEQLESALGFERFGVDKSHLPSDILGSWSTIGSDSGVFKMANGILIQEGLQLTEPYVKMVQDNFNGDIFFTGSPEANINKAFSERTENNIPEMLKAMPSEIVMMLLNGVYFKPDWMYPVYEDKSFNDIFNGHNDVEYKNVTYMTKFGRFGFISLYDLESDLIELPMKSDFIAMYAILPRDPNDDLSEIRSSLNVSYIESMINKLSYRHHSTVTLPRLHLDQEYDHLSEWLSKLGISDAFSASEAKFGKMSSSPLHLNDVLHRSRLNLAESTAQSPSEDDIEGALGAMAKPLLFEFNHPFLYFIRHKLTGQILLLGELHKF